MRKGHFEPPEVIEIIHRTETRRATTEIRVVQYNINGKKYRNLVKQDIFSDGENGLRYGKVRGLNGDDWIIVTAPQNINKIANALGKGAVQTPKAEPERMPVSTADGFNHDF